MKTVGVLLLLLEACQGFHSTKTGTSRRRGITIHQRPQHASFPTLEPRRNRRRHFWDLSSSAADAEWYNGKTRRRRRRSRPSYPTSRRSTFDRTQQHQQQILQDYRVPSVGDVLKFAVPAIGVWLCVPLLSMIDTSTVGSLAGTTELAALNPAIAVINYTSKLMSFLFSGTTAMMAAALTADRQDQKQSATTASSAKLPKTAKTLVGVLQISSWVGAGLGVAVLVFARQLLSAIIGGGGTVDPAIMTAAMKYVMIRAVGYPAAAVCGSAQVACLAQGDVKMPLYATVVAAVSNLVLDLALIRNPHMWIGGAAGAAWATTAAQYLAAGWAVRWLMSPNTKQQASPNSETTKTATSTTKGFLSGRMLSTDLFKLPTKKIFKGFTPFVIPVSTTQAGRASACATIDHVVSSSLNTASMAANQILCSVYYGLVPIAESLSLAAQSFVPGITERDVDSSSGNVPPDVVRKEQSFAMNRLLKNFGKAAGMCGLVLAAVMGTLPLYSGIFTTDAAVRNIVTAVVPLMFITSLKHGLFCSSEGILLGQKDLKFLGTQYGVYTFVVPYILLQLKKAALAGSSRVSLVSVWQVFLGYDIFRTILMMGRIAWLERKRKSASSY